MKFFLMVLMIVSITLPGFAQRELGNKTLTIPHFDSKNKTTASGSTSSSSSSSKFNVPLMDFPSIVPPSNSFSKHDKPLTTHLKRIGESDNNFMQKKEFKNPNEPYVAKLNNQVFNEYAAVAQKNQFLGNFKTKSRFVKVHFWDFGAIDGDIVTIYINDVPIASQVILSGESRIIELTFQDGLNEINIVAMNQGDVGGNTAQFQIYDEAGILIYDNMWNLATGFKATVIVVKE